MKIVKGNQEDFKSYSIFEEKPCDYVTYFRPSESTLPPIARIMNLKDRLNVYCYTTGEVLQKSSVVLEKEKKKIQNEVSEKIQSDINEVTFDLGVSSLQRIVSQMQDLRSAALRKTRKYAPPGKVGIPKCMPEYTKYLQGEKRSLWEEERRRVIYKILSN